MTWWDTPEWHAYEVACGEEAGTRARLLASADWQTRVVDLSLSEAELWQGVRRSYRSLIHAAERNYDIDDWCVDCDEFMVACATIHRRIAGKQTRPTGTWMRMGEWLKDDAAMLVLAHDGSTLIAYVYCVHYRSWAYYFSSACLVKNLNHALLWHAMKALKARGVRWLELGWLERDGDTAKDRQISFLKSGFGGVDLPAKDAPALCEKA